MSALSDVENLRLHDIADGDVRDDPRWLALMGEDAIKDFLAEMAAKHLPGQHNQDSHGNDHGVDVPNPLDKLRGAGRIDLAPGERLLRSDRMRGENGRAWLAVTEKDGKRSLRIGLGNAQFGTRHDAHGPWRAGPDRTAEINEERAELRAEIEDLENEIEDLEDDPNADPADIAERREQLEKLYGAESGVEELPGGYTAMLDENSARRLRETLAKALDDGKKLQAELDKPYAELDRLTLERDKLKRGAFGRKFTAEEDAEWDRLTAEIARAEAELDPDSGPERPEQGYWTLAEGSIPGQWADVHYDIYLDDPSVGVEVKLGAVPHGSDMDFQDLTGNEMAASLAADEAADLVKLLAKMESGNGSKSSRSTAVKHGSHNQEDHGNRYGGIDLIPPMAGLPVLSSEEYERSYGDVLDERVVSSGDDVDLSVRVFENGDSHIVLDLKGGRHQVMSDFDDSDGMRALASDIRDMQRADTPDGEGSGDVVADADSTLHDYYVAKDDLGNIWLRTNDQDEDDYLELSDDEADDLETALDDMADSLDEHFDGGEEKSLKHGNHDQRSHGRRGGRRNAGGIRRLLDAAEDVDQLAATATSEAKRITGRDIPFDFTGADLKISRDHAEGILEGLERFPEARLTHVGTYGPGSKPTPTNADLWRTQKGSFAVTSSYVAQQDGQFQRLSNMYFNNTFAGNPDLYAEELAVPGEHSALPSTARGVALHEFGHVLANHQGDIVRTVLDTTNAHAESEGITPRVYIKRNISAYASSSPAELAAEVFADVMLNGDKADGASKAAFRVMEAAYRGES